MLENQRVYVAGHSGLVGTAIVQRLLMAGHDTLVTRKRKDLDLTDVGATRRFFQEEKPDIVILAAARVGGILANKSYPAAFICENLSIQNNVIQEAWKAGVQNLLFLGTSCIYPKHARQPISEEFLLSGSLEPSNRPYALAKIAGIEMCWSFNRQYATRYLAVMPCNLYGPGDSYDLQNSHVLPALIRKAHVAKKNGEQELSVWGTGHPLRELLFVSDLADACVFILSQAAHNLKYLFNDREPPLINIGSGIECSIRQLAEIVCDVVGFKGRLKFDESKPDGTPRKLLDLSRINNLGWQSTTPLRDGIVQAYQDYLARYEK